MKKGKWKNTSPSQLFTVTFPLQRELSPERSAFNFWFPKEEKSRSSLKRGKRIKLEVKSTMTNFQRQHSTETCFYVVKKKNLEFTNEENVILFARNRNSTLKYLNEEIQYQNVVKSNCIVPQIPVYHRFCLFSFFKKLSIYIN
jgi:hypothetical protein